MAYYISNEGKETSSVFDITINVKTGGYLMTNVNVTNELNYLMEVIVEDVRSELDGERIIELLKDLQSENYLNRHSNWSNCVHGLIQEIAMEYGLEECV
jgi:hypothetical protein